MINVIMIIMKIHSLSGLPYSVLHTLYLTQYISKTISQVDYRNISYVQCTLYLAPYISFMRYMVQDYNQSLMQWIA